jgi:Tol biopolymer transport system component
MNIKFLQILFLLASLVGEAFSGETAHLANIRQLTFSSMGFVRAGEAYFSPDDRSIIFQAVPDGKEHYQMFVMDIEEGIPRMVSTGKGACTCGFFHPCGDKIIFASSHESPLLSKGNYVWDLTPYMNIYEANPDGTALKALTHGEAYHAECAYSPDGSGIVFASNMDGTMNLYIMDADGSNTRQLTTTTHCYNGGPFFSADGKRVVFRADREKPHYLQIFTIATDGTDERQHTDNGAVNWAPYWHPDNTHIFYTKSVGQRHNYEIFMLNLETGKEQQITDNPTFDGLPVINRSGTKLMWTSKRGEDRSCQIFIADFTM